MIVTPRLRLRRWRPEDLAPFSALNADAEVMRYFPAPLTEAETAALIDRIEAHFQTHAFGLWAAELIGTTECIGFIGLSVPRFQAHFTPCVEVGWRLAARYWNMGLATEGALAALDYGFETLGLEEIVSFTVVANLPSRRVMEKIGMTHAADDDFAHPNLPADHPLSRHVLYRARRSPIHALRRPARSL